MDIDSMINERKIDDMMEKELIGWIDAGMSDVEVILGKIGDELRAIDEARDELFDHFANL